MEEARRAADAAADLVEKKGAVNADAVEEGSTSHVGAGDAAAVVGGLVAPTADLREKKDRVVCYAPAPDLEEEKKDLEVKPVQQVNHLARFLSRVLFVCRFD
jgi:fructose-1-phosphate kinase PfkB-like protein